MESSHGLRCGYRMLASAGLLLTFIIQASAASGSPIRVTAGSTGLEPEFQSWFVVDVAEFRTRFGYNFTSCGMDWLSLPYTRAVVFTQGCWQEAVTGGQINSKRPCVRFTDSSLYLQRGSTYAVCGVSYFNNFFGQAGTVSIAVTETSKSLLSYASASVLQASPNGVSDASACLYLNPRPSGCAFNVASLCVECSSTDCSQATDGFCAGLNRQPCSILPNTCGACDECYLPADTDSGSGVAADGASGDAGSGDTASSSSSSSSASGTTQCYAVSSGSVLPAPQLQPDGATNAIGPSGASGTSIRIKWRKPDCDPVSMFKLRLREQGGPWVDVFQGHPGGGFSRGEALTVSVDRPTSDTSGSNGGSASSGSGGSGGASGGTAFVRRALGAR